jgi:uncharacterized membrane protein
MEKDRLVSDGVIAITIMVLELNVPHDATLDALVAVTPAFLSYALSFVSGTTTTISSTWFVA